MRRTPRITPARSRTSDPITSGVGPDGAAGAGSSGVAVGDGRIGARLASRVPDGAPVASAVVPPLVAFLSFGVVGATGALVATGAAADGAMDAAAEGTSAGANDAAADDAAETTASADAAAAGAAEG